MRSPGGVTAAQLGLSMPFFISPDPQGITSLINFKRTLRYSRFLFLILPNLLVLLSGKDHGHEYEKKSGTAGLLPAVGRPWSRCPTDHRREGHRRQGG
jgi:hypothetical protein